MLPTPPLLRACLGAYPSIYSSPIKLFTCYYSISVDNVPLSLRSFFSFALVDNAPLSAFKSVSFRVTISTKQFEVVEVQSDLRVVDVYRIEFDLVMYDLARLIYPLP